MGRKRGLEDGNGQQQTRLTHSNKDIGRTCRCNNWTYKCWIHGWYQWEEITNHFIGFNTQNPTHSLSLVGSITSGDQSCWCLHRSMWNCLKHDLIMNLNQLKFLYHKVGSDQVIDHIISCAWQIWKGGIYDTYYKWNKRSLSQSRFRSQIQIWDFIQLKVHRTKRDYFETLILIMCYV